MTVVEVGRVVDLDVIGGVGVGVVGAAATGRH